MHDANSNDKNIAVLTHLGGIFFSFLPGLIVWLLKKDDSAYIGEQAREALNFQITVLIGYMVASFFADWLPAVAGHLSCQSGAVSYRGSQN